VLTLCPTANELPCVRPSGHPAVRRCRGGRCRRRPVDPRRDRTAPDGRPRPRGTVRHRRPRRPAGLVAGVHEVHPGRVCDGL